MDVGKRVRQVREELGMPQTALARRVRVAPNTIYRVENGLRKPSVGLLEKIARVAHGTGGAATRAGSCGKSWASASTGRTT